MCLLYVGNNNKEKSDLTTVYLTGLESTIQHNLQIKFKQQWNQPWDLACRLCVIHTARWIGLRGMRWHLVMTERVLSCHLQLSLPLYRLFFFCHICHHHATGYAFIRSLSISTSQFRLTLLLHLHLPWFSLSLTLSLHPSPIPAHFFCLSRYALVFLILWLHLIWGGRRRGRSPAQSDALRGFILWKTSNLNADGNIFRWFNSTMCNIPNKAFFCFCFLQLFSCYAYWVFHKLLHLTNSENLKRTRKNKQMQKSLSKLVLSILKLCNYVC